VLGVPISIFFDGAPGGASGKRDEGSVLLIGFASAEGLALIKAGRRWSRHIWDATAGS
jgi:hypothetical protein